MGDPWWKNEALHKHLNAEDEKRKVRESRREKYYQKQVQNFENRITHLFGDTELLSELRYGWELVDGLTDEALVEWVNYFQPVEFLGEGLFSSVWGTAFNTAIKLTFSRSDALGAAKILESENKYNDVFAKVHYVSKIPTKSKKAALYTIETEKLITANIKHTRLPLPHARLKQAAKELGFFNLDTHMGNWGRRGRKLVLFDFGCNPFKEGCSRGPGATRILNNQIF